MTRTDILHYLETDTLDIKIRIIPKYLYLYRDYQALFDLIEIEYCDDELPSSITKRKYEKYKYMEYLIPYDNSMSDAELLNRYMILLYIFDKYQRLIRELKKDCNTMRYILLQKEG